MDVVDGDIGAVCLGHGGVGQKMIEKLLIHADAVVRDQQIEGVILPGSDDDSSGRRVFLQDAVEDGILQDGLEGELGDMTGVQLVRDVHHQVDGIFKAHILQLDINTGVLDLVSDGGDGIFF